MQGFGNVLSNLLPFNRVTEKTIDLEVRARVFFGGQTTKVAALGINVN